MYLYREPVEIEDLTLQVSEVEDAAWFDLSELRAEIGINMSRFCVAPEGFQVLLNYLSENK